MRYRRRSIGRSTGSMNVFSRLNTCAMKIPSGLVTRKTSTRNSSICNHPFAVMLEILWTQQCVNQIHGGQHADGKHDDRFEAHDLPSLHPFTKVNVSDCDGKKCDRNGYPKDVLHNALQSKSRLLPNLFAFSRVCARSDTPAHSSFKITGRKIGLKSS